MTSNNDIDDFKKPASVVFSTVFLALMSLLTFWYVVNGIIDPKMLLQMTLSVAALVCLVARRRSRATYYLTMVALGYWTANSVDAAHRFPNGMTPPANLTRSGMWAAAVIVCLLLWRFSLGRRSRAFFGFGSTDEPRSV